MTIWRLLAQDAVDEGRGPEGGQQARQSQGFLRRWVCANAPPVTAITAATTPKNVPTPAALLLLEKIGRQNLSALTPYLLLLLLPS